MARSHKLSRVERATELGTRVTLLMRRVCRFQLGPANLAFPSSSASPEVVERLATCAVARNLDASADLQVLVQILYTLL